MRLKGETKVKIYADKMSVNLTSIRSMKSKTLCFSPRVNRHKVQDYVRDCCC